MIFRLQEENFTNTGKPSDYGYAPVQPTEFSFVIRQFVLPLICLFGVIGNTLAVSTFLRPSLRRYSCSVLLATRAVSDNGFLITLFIVWLDFVDVRIFHTKGVCQITLFLSYVCSFLSVWCVAIVTLENYIRICHSTNAASMCTSKNAVYSVAVGIFIALLMYNFPLWATSVQVFGGKTFCMTKDRYGHFELALTYIDTLLTLIIPLSAIVICMTLIICSSSEARRRQERLNSHSTTALLVASRRHESPHTTVTRLLFVVTVMFLILHTPSHIIRVKVMIENITGNFISTSDTDRTLQQLLQILYYLNFSVNIMIYLTCGRNFRNVFAHMFCSKCVLNPEYMRPTHNQRTGSTDFVLKESEEDDTKIDYQNRAVVSCEG